MKKLEINKVFNNHDELEKAIDEIRTKHIIIMTMSTEQIDGTYLLQDVYVTD